MGWLLIILVLLEGETVPYTQSVNVYKAQEECRVDGREIVNKIFTLAPQQWVAFSCVDLGSGTPT